jgi:hypothetical protein
MGSARVYKFNTPYRGTDLAELTYAQTTDTMYLAHLSYPPSKIVRAGSTSWTFQTLTFGTSLAAPGSVSVTPVTANIPSGNYYPVSVSYVVTAKNDQNVESVASSTVTATNDLTLSGNYNTVSWAAVSGATRYDVYKSTVGGFFGYIGSTAGTSLSDHNIGPDYSRAPPKGITPFAAAGDYPSTVTLFQQRLIWARTTNAPNAIFASRTAQLENMNYSTPLRADDSISFAIVSGQATSLNGLTNTSYLLGLASDGVYIIDGDGQGGFLTATSTAARRQIGRGAGRLGAIVADSVVFYAPAVGNTVRTIGFDFSVDGLKSNDVSIFSPHLFESHTIVSWCYQREPRSIVWAVRDDGILLCFTWEEAQGVWGWTWCDTAGTVLAVCSITENGQDSVYLIVERTIAGVTKTYVEQLAAHLWTDVTQTCFVDCALTNTYAQPVSTVSGLWHLEGATNVAGVCDGVPVSGLTVTNGMVTLPASIGTASVITLGLPYQVDIETLPLRQASQGIGSNLGRIQGAQQAVVSVLNSANFLAGINTNQLFPVRGIDNQAWDNPLLPVTGDCIVSVDNKIQNYISLHIQQIAASPLTVLGVSLDPVING